MRKGEQFVFRIAFLLRITFYALRNTQYATFLPLHIFKK